jgi:hypothetical protein
MELDTTRLGKARPMSNVTSLMESNKAFARSGAWRNAPPLPFLPFHGLYTITCVDGSARSYPS